MATKSPLAYYVPIVESRPGVIYHLFMMPIKLPKGFVRRKSSGNALEEVENRPQSSFRVFERPSGDARSASEGNLLAPKSVNAARRRSQPLEDSENIFAGSPGAMSKNRYGHSHSTFFCDHPGTTDQT